MAPRCEIPASRDTASLIKHWPGCWRDGRFNVLNKVSIHSKHGVEMWQYFNHGDHVVTSDTGQMFNSIQSQMFNFYIVSRTLCLSFVPLFLPCCLYFWRLVRFTSYSGWSFIKLRWMLLHKSNLLSEGSPEDGILGASCGVYPLRWFTASLHSEQRSLKHWLTHNIYVHTTWELLTT